MFNYITVDFPNSTAAPRRVFSLTLYQNRYEHEIAVLRFRDWAVEYEAVEAGSPIHFTIAKLGQSKEFYGYINHINVARSPGYFMTEVVAVSPSFGLKNERQTVYKNLSADAVVQRIAGENGMVAFTMETPRIYPQIAQAGHTDWELLVRLAKQNGYSLRTENTEIYLQPIMYEYTLNRSEAPLFVMREANHPSGSTIYSFEPIVGENLSFDGEKKAAIAVTGFDLPNKSITSYTKQKESKKTKSKSAPAMFDKYKTEVVAIDHEIAKYEAEAAEARAYFPYRATAEVIGNPTLRPDMPVYLDGVGNLYAGYWMVLGTEHRIIEEERNAQTYTTILHLGADSLGLANRGNDGKIIHFPDKNPKRAIKPGVRQTKVKPKTKIKATAPKVGPQTKGKFSKATNRSSGIKGPTWVTNTARLNPISVSNKSTPQVPSRAVKIKGIV